MFTQSQARRFEQLFGEKLTDYRDIVGFDVIRFDEQLAKPVTGESTAHATDQKFRTEATELIRELLSA